MNTENRHFLVSRYVTWNELKEKKGKKKDFERVKFGGIVEAVSDDVFLAKIRLEDNDFKVVEVSELDY